MLIIPLSSLFIPPNRQRKEFDLDALTSLSESIRLHGLLHPPVVAEEDGRYRLVAGERRVRAISSLSELDISFLCGREVVSPGTLPVTLLTELDALSLREVELEENTIRLDLTWQELAAARAELNSLRREQNPSHTIADTAREIFGSGKGSNSMAVREAVILQPYLNDPEIGRAKSQAEAIKLLGKKKEREHRETLASSILPTQSDFLLLEGDFYEASRQLPSNEFDCILTDPPYGIGADSFGDQADLRHNYSDDPETVERLLDAVARESFRVSRPSAHAYCFCSFEWFARLSAMWARAGWSVWPRPIIWYKGNQGFLPRPDHGPRYTYECVLFASKGDKKTLRVAHDVVSFPLLEDRIHAAQKPVELYLDLLSRSCLPGDRVVDFFAGSGTIFRAARKAKLKATGIEKDQEHIGSCKKAILGEE